ncbi:MAG: MarR family transcriptional regulator [Microbacterium sp.]
MPDPAPGGLPAGSPPPPATEQKIAEVISELSSMFAFSRNRWQRLAQETLPDLTNTGFTVLSTIDKQSPITTTELSQVLDLDKAAISRHVAKLREAGLIAAETSPDDGRVTLLTMSTAGHAAIDQVRANWTHAYVERFAGWAESDLEQLRRGLRHFNASTADAIASGPALRCARSADKGQRGHEAASTAQ